MINNYDAYEKKIIFLAQEILKIHFLCSQLLREYENLQLQFPELYCIILKYLLNCSRCLKKNRLMIGRGAKTKFLYVLLIFIKLIVLYFVVEHKKYKSRIYNSKNSE